MSDFIARVRVVLTAAPTYLTAFAVAASVLAQELPGTTVAEWAVRVGVWLAAAVGIIRQVTPVLPDQRGLLPRDE